MPATKKNETADKTSRGQVSEFRVSYSLHPGLSDARSMNDPSYGRRFPPTRAGLALGLDYVDHENIRLAGCYGTASCALIAVLDDGELLVSDDGELLVSDDGSDDAPGRITESRAYELLTEEGELDSCDVFAMRESVWDGHNYVEFTPSRSIALLTDDDCYERIGCALVQWNEFGGCDDVRVDEGWAILDEYWGTLGNQSWAYDLGDDAYATKIEIERRLTDAKIEFCRVELDDDDLLICVRTEDLAAAQSAMEIVEE